jgi:hypothetical protein
MILAIDFDDTIHDRQHPLPNKRMGAPLPGAVEALETLAEQGNTIIVHTVMATTGSGTKAVQDWLEFYDVPHHGVTAIKPQADWYIDDKAIRHVDWNNTLQELGVFDD